MRMSEVAIYHNPRCSKSRETLSLLRTRGIDLKVVLYLEDPPGAPELNRLLKMLNMGPKDLMRKKEPEYRILGIEDKPRDWDELVSMMVENPILLERPIVVKGNQARLGRPPESVLEIL